jgi:peroxiredoxin
MSLKEQLVDYRAGWYKRVPVERQAIMQRHIDQLRRGAIAHTMLKVGDRAPTVALKNAKGETVDVSILLKKGPVIVTFYRGGWCPYCNLELRAYQEILPEIAAAGASLVAISPEKPDDTLSTAEKNALAFEVLSDVGRSAWSMNLVTSLSPRIEASTWIFQRSMARQTNGPCPSRPLMSSIATGSSPMPIPIPIIVIAPILAIF